MNSVTNELSYKYKFQESIMAYMNSNMKVSII